jgi:hypothetical protein
MSLESHLGPRSGPEFPALAKRSHHGSAKRSRTSFRPGPAVTAPAVNLDSQVGALPTSGKSLGRTEAPLASLLVLH